MFWLARQSYLRWTGAILLVAVSFYFEIRPQPGILHPFTARDLSAGTGLDESSIEWRRVPRGLLAEVDPTGVLRVDVSAGEALTPSIVGGQPVAPAGWWAIELPVPKGTHNGAEVRLVVDIRNEPRVIPGMVIRMIEGSGFDASTGLVAIPESEVGAAAAAAADSTLEVLVGS